MKHLLVLTAAVALSGCAGFGLSDIADRGADVSDAALEANEWGLCRASTMGAWLRRYGADPGRADAWARLCLPELASPLGPVQR